jgi:Zn-dependent protease
MKQYPATPREDAIVGLAGPIWGLGAAVVAAGGWYATGIPLLAALAHVGAWLNLFNLLPVWSLDGGRGFRALDTTQRWLAVAALFVAWGLSEDSMVMVVAVIAAGATLIGATPLPPHGDRRTLATYVALVITLAGLLAWVPDPLHPG